MSVDHHGTAQFCLPERHIEYVVQTERNQSTFQNAVDPCAGVTGVEHQCSQIGDSQLDNRPQVKHDDADDQIDYSGNNGHEPCSAKEREHLRQFDLIEPVVQGRNAQSHQNTAKHAHLQCGNAKHRSGGVGCHGFYAALSRNQRTHGSVHDQIGNRTGERSNFLFLFRHANGNAHGEQQCQIVKDSTPRLAHDVQDGVEQSALIDDVSQMVSFNGRGIGKGTSQTQQKSRHRQQCNGKHERASHPLQYAKNLVFHHNILLSDFHYCSIKTLK